MKPNSEDTQVSIVIPAFNEGAAIEAVIRSIQEVMKGTAHAFEILVVDDASEDNTVEMAQRQGARVIRHEENRGSGASRKTGILAAKGQWIVMIDGDGTYPPDAIPELIGHLDVFPQVIGARVEEKGTHRIPRILAKEIIRRLAAFIVGKRIPDLNSGLRAFRKSDMVQFLHLIPDGFSCVSSMTLAFLASDLPVKFVPIPYFERIGRSKFHPVKDTYRYLLTVIRIMAYFAPLNVFMPLCLLLLALGVVKGVLDLIWTASLQESDIILFLTGIIIGAIGILADLIVTQGRRHHGQSR
jgi:glycosyltransferase involved in cell wall biosynthesis